MSASDKKKLRKEQAAEFLSEKQRKEQAEAKKLRIYTISFITAMVLIVAITVGVLGFRAINQSGVIQKSTIALNIGDRQLNTVELSYYYKDAIDKFYNEWYEQYSSSADSYLAAMGLDTSKPLSEQVYDKETGKTWDMFFIDAAIDQAKSDFALYDLAMKDETFKLPEDQQTTLDNMFSNLSVYATLYGYSSTKQYLGAMYGWGADEESFKEYNTRSEIAKAYYAAHEESLKYDDAAIRAYEEDKKDNYNSYNYSYAYLSYNDFITGGTKSEDGKTTTYTDAEKDAARAAMKAAAEEMATATTLDELKQKAKDAPVNEKSALAVNAYTNVLHTGIDGLLNKWLSDPERKPGDIAAIANVITGEDGKVDENATVNAYYVIYFESKNDNTHPMGNVRHLLVKFEGGTKNEETGETTYSDAEKNKAKVEAEGYLKTYNDGEKTEKAFIELVKKHSDDSSKDEGGLFEDIHPDSNYVPNFLSWSTNPDRQAGDVEVIETEYGYHVMYYVGDDELTYRDYMISNELREADMEKWHNGLKDTITTSVADLSKMDLDMVING